MKKLLSVLIGMLVMLLSLAQAPNQINYQGIARNSKGNGVSNHLISVRLTIHDGSSSGPVVFSEQRTVTTNTFGLFNIAIGSPGASNVVGSIAGIIWASGSKYLQVEMDPDGGSAFLNMGTTQLLSVPYALYATSATPVGPAGGDLTGTYPNPTVAKIRGVNVSTIAPATNNILGYNGSSWTPVSLATHPDNYWRLSGSNIYNANAGNVGIGTTTPAQKLDVNGTVKTLGFMMPTGAGAGKVLLSDALGVGSWSSNITATKIVLPYKDSATSETANIFDITQTSLTSGTSALYGATRSSGAGANAVKGFAPLGVGVFGQSNSYYGVYGNSSTQSAIFGSSTVGFAYAAGVFGYDNGYGGNGIFGYSTRSQGFGAVGVSDSSTGVYGLTNATNYAAAINDGVAVYGLASKAGIGVYGNSAQFNAARFESKNASNASDILFVTNAGTGRSAYITNSNPANSSTLLEVNSTSTGAAILARSNLQGYINGGVIDSRTDILGGNSIFGRATRTDGWGVGGLSDSSAGVAGVGYRNMSTGVYGQGWEGTAGKFVIDNTLPNSNNVLEVSNTQTGSAIRANSNLGMAADFENTNAANGSTVVNVNSNGTGRAIVARSNFQGFINAGVIDSRTDIIGGNAVYGRATRNGAWGIYGLSDSSAAVAGIGYRNISYGIYGQGWEGVAGHFIIDNTLPNTNNTLEAFNTQSGAAIYGNSTNGNAAKFENTNPSNTSDLISLSSNSTSTSTATIHAINGSSGLFTGYRNTIWGESDNGAGVFGSSADGVGVVGGANNGLGIWGFSENGFASIYASHSNSGLGLYATSNNGGAAQFQIFNSLNNSTVLDINSAGTGRAIVARSNFQGFINAGVIDSRTDILGGNAVYGRATKSGAWGIYGLSDSSAAVAGVGYRSGSVGIYGQGWMGGAGQFVIDNTYANNSDAVLISTTQGGNGVSINVNNTASGINLNQSGSGHGIYSNSVSGIAARFENTNAGNTQDIIYATTNGTGRAFEGIVDNTSNSHAAVRGESNGPGYGVAGVETNDVSTGGGIYGLHTGTNGNGAIGWATRINGFGMLAHADSSIGTYGESIYGNAAYFTNLSSSNNLPALYTQTIGNGNAASFNVTNSGNTADAVTINRVGAGRSLFVSGAAFSNPMDFKDPVTTGKSTARFEGNSGLAVLAHSNGVFQYSGINTAVAVYGITDGNTSEQNFGLVGKATAASNSNVGVFGYVDGATTGLNVAVFGGDYSSSGTHYAGYFDGDVVVTGNLSKGGGSFKIDHPLDPQNKYLVHSFVESPDMMNVYNGNATTDASGKVSVSLPSYFEAENVDFKYQLTVIGQFAQAIIGEEIKNNQFVIMTDKPNVKVSWQVTGVRNDKWAQSNRIVPEVEKKGNEHGKYLYPELYGQPKESGITILRKNSRSDVSSLSRVSQNTSRLNQDDQMKVNQVAEQKSNQVKILVKEMNPAATAKLQVKDKASIQPAKDNVIGQKIKQMKQAMGNETKTGTSEQVSKLPVMPTITIKPNANQPQSLQKIQPKSDVQIPDNVSSSKTKMLMASTNAEVKTAAKNANSQTFTVKQSKEPVQQASTTATSQLSSIQAKESKPNASDKSKLLMSKLSDGKETKINTAPDVQPSTQLKGAANQQTNKKDFSKPDIKLPVSQENKNSSNQNNNKQ